jgi:hypothetical protein
MSAMGWALGGWLFLNLIIIVALLNRRSMPSVREKLFWWVIGKRPFESPDHRKTRRSQLNERGRSVVTPIGGAARRRGEAPLQVFALLAVIGILVVGSVVFISKHPRSIAACAFNCG